MAIRTVVTRGFGNGTFNGTIALLVTRGYAPGEAVAPGPEQTKHGWKREDIPTRRRYLRLPKGGPMTVTEAQVDMIRQIIDAERIAQLAAIEAKSTRKRKKAMRRFEAEAQEITVSGEPPIVLPPQISALPGYDDKDGLRAAIYQMLQMQENDALILLLMVS